MSDKKESGDRGEEMAAAYLVEHGYTIVARNWRVLKLEVDIIARLGDLIVFAEVKARATREFGDPSSFVKKIKQQNLIRAANRYCILNNFHGEIRFDVISVFDYGTGAEVDHIEEAFYPLVNQNKL
jgi:putative endonuclease